MLLNLWYLSHFIYIFRWVQVNRLGNDSQTDELQDTMLKGELAWLSTYLGDTLTCTLIKVGIMYSLVICNSCQASFCKSMLVRKLPFYWLVVELLVYFTFHVHFWIVSRWKSWQCHSDRWASKDNAEKIASVAFFILRKQFNSHFDQGQNHVFSCNIQFMPRIFV